MKTYRLNLLMYGSLLLTLIMSMGCEQIEDQEPDLLSNGVIRQNEQLGKWWLRQRIEKQDFRIVVDEDNVRDVDGKRITICFGRGNDERRGMRTNFDGLRGIGTWQESNQQLTLMAPRQGVFAGETVVRVYTQEMQGDTVMTLRRSCDNPTFDCIYVFSRITTDSCWVE